MTQNTLPTSEDARRRWLTVARVVWVAVALVNLVLFVASVPAYWIQLNTVCADPSGATCNFPQLNPVKLQALERLGATINAYAAYTLTIHIVASLAFLSVGVLIFWRRSSDWYGLFVSLFLIGFGTIGPSGVSSTAEPRCSTHKKDRSTYFSTPAPGSSRRSAYLSKTSLILPFFSLAVPLVWSARPSAFLSLLPVREPAASFARPLAVSSAPSFLSWLLLFLPTRLCPFLGLSFYGLRLRERCDRYSG
jgi:hypothetical protein